MTRPKLGRFPLNDRQRFLLRSYSLSVRDGHEIPVAERAELAAAMERAGAPTARDARRLGAREKQIMALKRASRVKKK